MDNIKINKVSNHVEVVLNGKVIFTSDTKQLAIAELKSQINI